ncbi:MAG: hypothetical protein ABIK73_07095 [candidate division WOR-3 bacterium]
MSVINKSTVDGNLVEALAQSFSEYSDGVQYAVKDAFPEILVTSTTGQFPIYVRENALQIDDIEKAPGSLPKETNIYVETGTWSAKHISLSTVVPDGQNVFGFNAHDAAIKTLWSKIWAWKESKFASQLFGAGVTSTSTSGNLRTDVNVAKNKVYAASGLVPNALIISYPALQKLLNSSDFLEMFPGFGVLTEQQRLLNLPSIFGLQRLIVSTAAYSPDAAPLDVTTVNSILPSDEFAVAVVAENGSDLSAPSAGRTFKVAPSESRPFELTSVYDAIRAATIHTIHMDLDIRLIDGKMAHRITGI